MGDVMAIVTRKTVDEAAEYYGELHPGLLLAGWDDYESTHPALERYLEDGDRLFLVTVRQPGAQLWVVAVYEDVERRPSGWFGRTRNRTPIVDITHLRQKLRFHHGKGLDVPDARLPQSLQTPRLLAPADVALLETAIGKHTKFTLEPPRRASSTVEAAEGERVAYEVSRYTRAPALTLRCLKRDRYRCRHCGFALDKRRILRLDELRRLGRVLHAHHVDPLHDIPARKTPLARLITLCPTCHAVAHALARALGVTRKLDLALLARHYRPLQARR